MLPDLRSRGAEAEKLRRISDKTIHELQDIGAMKAVVPANAGGHEVAFPAVHCSSISYWLVILRFFAIYRLRIQ